MSVQIAHGVMAVANTASSSHGIPVHGVLVCGVLVASLAVRARIQRGRLRRSYMRAMSRSSARGRIRAFEKQGVLSKAHAAGRAKWAVRKAVIACLALGALVLWMQMKAGR